MTSEERLDRIEHAIAGWIEQSRQEHAENRAMCRETDRQIRETNAQLQMFQAESRLEWNRIRAENEAAWKLHREEAAARDKMTDKRIADLVSAIGEFIRKVDAR